MLVNETGQMIEILNSGPSISDIYDFKSFKADVDASHMEPLCCHNVTSCREGKQRRITSECRPLNISNQSRQVSPRLAVRGARAFMP